MAECVVIDEAEYAFLAQFPSFPHQRQHVLHLIQLPSCGRRLPEAGRDEPPDVLSGNACDPLVVPVDACSSSTLTIASTGEGRSAAGLLCRRHMRPKIAFSVRIV